MKGGGGGAAADKQMDCCGLQVAGLLCWGTSAAGWSGDGSGAPTEMAHCKTHQDSRQGRRLMAVRPITCAFGCWPADETKRLSA